MTGWRRGPGIAAGLLPRLRPQALILALLLAGCAPASGEPRPPVIAYGQDVCEACGMIISEARYAAATLVEAGDPHKFESIGDMVIYHMDHPDQKVLAWFVHDYDTENWIRAETAFYVLSAEIHAPMPPGLIAFESQAAAQTQAQALGASVLSFDEMRAAVHLAAH